MDISKIKVGNTAYDIKDTTARAVMGASGESHASGLVPDPGETAGTSKFLCEDGTWLIPLNNISTDNGHEYVEIGGIKWATMNVGANSVTDTGFYYQYGDTVGYLASQIGSGSGKKYFGWADYKYGNGTNSPGETGMTKYNSTDGKTVLDIEDDAVWAIWGGGWRTPTLADFQSLNASVNTEWTSDYLGSGIAGTIMTDKSDPSKVLFFPAAGFCSNGNVGNINVAGRYLTSSITRIKTSNYAISCSSNGINWNDNYSRYVGGAIRGILKDTLSSLKDIAFTGDYNDLSNKPIIPVSLPANGGNADTVDGYHVSVVSSMPAEPDANTIYIVQ